MMFVTLSGIVIEVRPEQLKKALPPMLVTLSGITLLLHPMKRVFVVVFIIALQLSLLSYTELFASTEIDVRPEQPEKAEDPMLVTLSGIVMELRPEQFWKA